MSVIKSVQSVAKSNIVKSVNFSLKTRPSLPKAGLHNAVIGEVANETGTEAGKQINRIRVPVILEAQDAAGKNYILDEVYNIGENGRGLSALCKDYLAWSGIEVTKADIYDFNCNEAMKDRSVVVKVAYRVNGANVAAVIESFHPAGTTELAAA
jgi:hypothetical protein